MEQAQSNIEQSKRSPIQWALFRFVFIFFPFFITSYSFAYSFLPDIGKPLSPFYEKLARFCGSHFLHISNPCTYKPVSDSTGMYINTVLLLLVSAIGCLIWTVLDPKRANYKKLFYGFLVGVRYYVAIQLLIYGFNKVFKWQFYLPEPNTLYSNVGNMPSDLLYWTTMGISHTYTVFCGVIEVIPALLLLFRRTTLLGSVIAIAVMLNVVFINFSYDINVKLHSLSLLFFSMLLAAPYTQNTIRFFMGKQISPTALWAPDYCNRRWKILYPITKTIVIGFILSAVLYPFIKAKNFNDDTAPRGPLCGAYTVTSFIKNRDTLALNETDTLRWKRMFIHSRGYLIIQKMNDEMHDYALYLDTAKKQLFIEAYTDTAFTPISYSSPAKDKLTLKQIRQQDTLTIYLKKEDLSKLPALEKGFHWTIDY